jgi:hypothetical protein
MDNIPADLMFYRNIRQEENIQVPEIQQNIINQDPEIIPNIQPIDNNQVPDIEEEIQLIHENINIIREPNQRYYVWYCLEHGDCFLTSRYQEPQSRDSRCGVLDECEYEYLGFLSLRNGINFYPQNRLNIRDYFEFMNDGYTEDMFTNMISSPQGRNEAILY